MLLYNEDVFIIWSESYSQLVIHRVIISLLILGALIGKLIGMTIKNCTVKVLENRKLKGRRDHAHIFMCFYLFSLLTCHAVKCGDIKTFIYTIKKLRKDISILLYDILSM